MVLHTEVIGSNPMGSIVLLNLVYELFIFYFFKFFFLSCYLFFGLHYCFSVVFLLKFNFLVLWVPDLESSKFIEVFFLGNYESRLLDITLILLLCDFYSLLLYLKLLFMLAILLILFPLLAFFASILFNILSLSKMSY